MNREETKRAKKNAKISPKKSEEREMIQKKTLRSFPLCGENDYASLAIFFPVRTLRKPCLNNACA